MLLLHYLKYFFYIFDICIIFFYEIIKNDEIILLKNNGLSNFKIIKNLFFSTFIMGILIVIVYYNLSSKLNFFIQILKIIIVTTINI